MTMNPAVPVTSPPAARTTVPMGAIAASVVLVELSSGITQGFLAPVLRSLTDVLGVTAAHLNWLWIANLLASVAFTPFLSRMGDLYGHRRILRWNLAIVLLGSVLVGLATSFGMLLVGQVLQGAFAGFFPLLVGILRNRTDGGESRRGIALMVAALVGGLAIGSLTSGLVATSVDDPTAALWVPFAAVTLALIVSWPLLPESENSPGGSLDWFGGGLVALGLVGVMLGLGQGGTPGWEWSSTRTLVSLIGGVLVLAVWVLVELRTAAPMIDVRLFRRRNVSVVATVTTTFAFCLIGLQVATAIFLGTPRELVGYGLGLSPLAIAVAMLPNFLILALGALLAPRLAARIGDRFTLVTGSGIMAAGYLATVVAHDSLGPFVVVTAVAGFGAGLMQHSTRTLAVECVPHDQAAVGSGINELLINVGGSLGVAFVLSIAAAATLPGQTFPALDAYVSAWTMCAVVSVVGAVVALLFRPTTELSR
jgi:MFS family permease